MRRRPTPLWAMLLAGAGCVSGPAPRTYVLVAPAEAWASPAPPPGAPGVEVSRILLPDYLDTTDLVLRSGAHELRVSPTGRWGERLSTGLTAALAAALAVRLPQDAVALDAAEEPAARRIFVNLAGFDVWPDGHCVLTASWTVQRGGTPAAVSTGSETFEVAAAGPGAAGDAGVVAAMAQAVGLLADRLSAVIPGPPFAAVREDPPETMRQQRE